FLVVRTGAELLPHLPRVLDLELDATVLRTTLGGGIAGHRIKLAVALGADDLRFGHAMVDQVVLDELGATLGQLQVIGLAADRIGVAVDLDFRVRVALQRIGGLFENGHGVSDGLVQNDPENHRHQRPSLVGMYTDAQQIAQRETSSR
ncbi:hypothetical protein, partial [Metallibacterium sp.]|uniref:hypothetical protein n=1 Tax=Metallibacterium sp. TaxID=2940281 RepID=UPI00262CB2A4